MPEYKANFLWPHEDGSVEQAGYEFANAQTEAYRKQWWDILLERAAQHALHRTRLSGVAKCRYSVMIAHGLFAIIIKTSCR